jgi:hypothetical protein
MPVAAMHMRPPDKAFEVEKIVGMKRNEGGVEYCLRWVGFKPKDDTWEPAGSISAEPKSGDGLISMWNRREDQRIYPRANKRQNLDSRKVQLQELLSLIPPPVFRIIREYEYSYEDCVSLLPELLRPEQRREYYFT